MLQKITDKFWIDLSTIKVIKIVPKIYVLALEYVIEIGYGDSMQTHIVDEEIGVKLIEELYRFNEWQAKKMI